MLRTSLLRNNSTSFAYASLFFSFQGNLLLSIELAVWISRARDRCSTIAEGRPRTHASSPSMRGRRGS